MAAPESGAGRRQVVPRVEEGCLVLMLFQQLADAGEPRNRQAPDLPGGGQRPQLQGGRHDVAGQAVPAAGQSKEFRAALRVELEAAMIRMEERQIQDLLAEGALSGRMLPVGVGSDATPQGDVRMPRLDRQIEAAPEGEIEQLAERDTRLAAHPPGALVEREQTIEGPEVLNQRAATEARRGVGEAAPANDARHPAWDALDVAVAVGPNDGGGVAEAPVEAPEDRASDRLAETVIRRVSHRRRGIMAQLSTLGVLASSKPATESSDCCQPDLIGNSYGWKRNERSSRCWP